jgi:hypothetical protein
MENRASVGIRLTENEPDFMSWFAIYHPELAQMLFTRYLRHIAHQRHLKRRNSDTPRPGA